ncbi:MAG TPA: ROK family protein [Methylomirabilota bacterium]|nr:ROK family protein [Methylomirabilota bacterium]
MSIVGIDIGGTNVRVVVVDRSGRVLARTSLETRAEQGPVATFARIFDAIRGLAPAPDPRIEAIGIGATGPVDPLTGIVDNPYTLGGWPPTDLRTPFAEAFAAPVVVDNDANVAAAGEWWAGAARGYRRVAMVTVGTGIGVAALIDGKIQRAVDGRHGEAGHMVLDPNGPECYCGARGCWEVLASGTALGRNAKERAKRDGGLLMELAGGDADAVDGKILFEAAARGDVSAAAVIDEAASWIGLGLVNLAATLTPDVIVLGGGVTRRLPAMRAGIEAVLRRHAVMVPTDMPVVAAELGEDAGPIGAARLAAGHEASPA